MSRRKGDANVNVTPMIDVVMCLIIFFLLVGRLVVEQRAEMPLPPSRTGDAQKLPEPVFINVAARRDPLNPALTTGVRVQIDRDEVGLDQIGPALSQRLASTPTAMVHLRAERTLPFEAVEPVLRACREIGVGSVRLATEKVP